MSKDFTVTINHPQRRLEWLEVFGTTHVHVKSFVPEFAQLAGNDEPQPVYYVDLSLLTPQQRQRLARHLAARFNLTISQAEHSLDERGVPIPAADCTVTIRNPEKWL